MVGQHDQNLHLTKNSQQNHKSTYEKQSALQVSKGETGIKSGISDVLNALLPHYNYVSFEEVNAGLRLYNVSASRGEDGSRLNKLGGLLYYALDNDGKRVSVPLRASSFELKPTLKYLEKRYKENLAERREIAHHIDTYVNWVMEGTRPTWKRFTEAMEREGISIVIQTDRNRGKENLFFVHHANKFIVEAESLGSEYSLQVLKEKCSLEEQQEQGLRHRHTLRI